jgi:bifunctional DNA-binding transcriptional regulator/antitoxin component of YhaV-PrlF toxin-antitoxin module
MSTVVDPKNHLISDKKIVSISSKRQITIPRKFFDALNFADEAECVVRGNELILRPARTKSGGEFAEHILADLIASGLTGEELLREFKNRQAKVRPAIEAMIAEADKVAVGNGEYYTYDDVFGTGK